MDDAAGAFAQRLTEKNEGAATAGAVNIWGVEQIADDAKIFDIVACFTVTPEDEDELDGEIEILGRDAKTS